MKSLLLLFLALATTVAWSSPQNYYYGKVEFFSVDGSKSMGSTVSLVSRLIDPENKKIVEIVTQPKDIPEKGADEFTTEIIQKEQNTFTASDFGHTFQGTIIFFGKDWEWNSWDYNITMETGGNIIGSGFVSPTSGIQTNKTFITPGFSMKIIESLLPISENDYSRLRKEMSRN